MNINDPIGDMLTRIRNAQRVGMHSVVTPASKARSNVLEVLLREGYIRAHSTDTPSGEKFAQTKIELKYRDGEPAIKEIKRISKPGRRVYTTIADMPRIYNGMGIAIVSTSKGVMSDAEARLANIGGELLCSIF